MKSDQEIDNDKADSVPETQSEAQSKVVVIFDGLLDPNHARQLSGVWADAGIDNRLDASGQSAELSMAIDEVDEQSGIPVALLEAMNLARAFGLELRDRIGKQFQAGVTTDRLHEHVAREYRQSIAQWVSFGLPAFLLHLLAPFLARGGGEASSMAFPWLIEMLMCGWLLRVAVWPVFWQGLISLMHLRLTADLYASLVLLLLFIPSSWGVISLLWQDTPWFIGEDGGGGPVFHLAVIYTGLLAYQRWGLHRFADQLSGNASQMLPILNHLMFLSLLVAAIVFWRLGYDMMMAVLLLLPVMMSMAINPWYPANTLLFSWVSFGLLIFLGQKPLANFGVQMTGHELNAALSFHAVMAFSFVAGWKRMET